MLALLLVAQLALASPAIIDGDTLTSRGVRYRLADVDAPEIGARAACPAEAILGQAARDRAQALIAGGFRVAAAPAEGNAGEKSRDRQGWPRDRFGRRLARVSIDGRDLGDVLIAEGLAAPWNGRKRDWCAG